MSKDKVNELDEREKKIVIKERTLAKKESEFRLSMPRLIEEKFSKLKTELDLLIKNNLAKHEELLKSEAKMKLDFDQWQKDTKKKIIEDNSNWIKLERDKAFKKIEKDHLELNKALELKQKELESKQLKLSSMKSDLDRELSEIKVEKLNQLDIEISQLREKRLNFVHDEIGKEQAEWEAKKKDLLDKEKELTALRDDIELREAEIERLKFKLEQKEEKLNIREKEIDSEVEIEVKFMKASLEANEKELTNRLNNIDKVIKDRMQLEHGLLLDDLQRYIDENNRLKERIDSNERSISIYETLKAELGDNPHNVLNELERHKLELKEVHEQLSQRPSKDLAKRYRELEEELGDINSREEDLTKREEDYRNAINNSTKQIEEINILKEKIISLEKSSNFLEKENKRLTAAYNTEAGEEERKTEINRPYITKLPKRVEADKIKETKWLESITQKIENQGLKFPKRIIYAFHTALKTSEISPLTVLSGVSGTGKSELPRLYSHFGGLNFLPVPVQPNWDSQEAMLGYYNSIDNYFDAQDVLRFLAQSQRNPNDQHGLNDVMNLILLDEMNLSNVELYFSDFLSKLETRRGCSDDMLPSLGVKIGAKMSNWELPLGRNVLWTGTMNQDETTKSLSDKVIDRGIVINFPSPDKLISKTEKKELPIQDYLLSTKQWNNWLNQNIQFEEKAITKYRDRIQDINTQLNRTGRALGHRVWQSIESYMSHYPTVISNKNDKNKFSKEMDKAFEDQLVQKVMPKLRGIENRGTQGEVLDSIKAIIPDTLHDDYQNARDMGYGQFMWSTSKYLLRGE